MRLYEIETPPTKEQKLAALKKSANTYNADLSRDKIAFHNMPSDTVDFKKIKNIIDTKCKGILASYQQHPDKMLYKGTRKASIYPFYGDTRKWQRKSANTINLFTSLIDYLPSWRGYPLRSQSLICTTHKGVADVYGKPYVIFPYDDAIMARGDAEDFWENFGRDKQLGGLSLASYFQLIRDIVVHFANRELALNKTPRPLEDLTVFDKKMSIEELKKISDYIIKNHEKMIAYIDMTGDYMGSLKTNIVKEIVRAGGLIPFANQLLDPEENDIIKFYPEDFTHDYNYVLDKEVWFSGRFIAVPLSVTDSGGTWNRGEYYLDPKWLD